MSIVGSVTRECGRILGDRSGQAFRKTLDEASREVGAPLGKPTFDRLLRRANSYNWLGDAEREAAGYDKALQSASEFGQVQRLRGEMQTIEQTKASTAGARNSSLYESYDMRLKMDRKSADLARTANDGEFLGRTVSTDRPAFWHQSTFTAKGFFQRPIRTIRNWLQWQHLKPIDQEFGKVAARQQRLVGSFSADERVAAMRRTFWSNDPITRNPNVAG